MDKTSKLSESLLQFQETLDKTTSWPCEYTFKFIVLAVRVEELVEQLGFHEITKRPSKNGKYISISSTQKVTNSHQVIEVYRKASKIKGVITL